MSNSYDEIKKLLKASKNLQKPDTTLEEIRKRWNTNMLISEQEEQGMKKIDMVQDIEDEIEDDTEVDNKKGSDSKQQKYRVSGGYIILHGQKRSDLQLTIDEKTAFQDTMDEFIDGVSNLVEFYPLNLYTNTVEWSGKIINLDIEFIFSVGETNGIYLNGSMNKVDEDYLQFVDKLQKFYEQFKMKWGNILTTRKKTEPTK